MSNVQIPSFIPDERPQVVPSVVDSGSQTILTELRVGFSRYAIALNTSDGSEPKPELRQKVCFCLLRTHLAIEGYKRGEDITWVLDFALREQERALLASLWQDERGRDWLSGEAELDEFRDNMLYRTGLSLFAVHGRALGKNVAWITELTKRGLPR